MRTITSVLECFFFYACPLRVTRSPMWDAIVWLPVPISHSKGGYVANRTCFLDVQMIAKNQDKMKSSAAAEILDGVVTAPKAPMAAAAVAKPPPMTFTMPPRQARRKEA
jgi:hypothetical protein